MYLWSITNRSPWPYGADGFVLHLHPFQPGSFSAVSQMSLSKWELPRVFLCCPAVAGSLQSHSFPSALKDREKQLRLPAVDFGCFPQSEYSGYQRMDAEKQIPSKCVLDGD